MRILALLTDGFGGRGGIAKFNRELLGALASHPECSQIMALPRVMSEPSGPVPPGISWRTDGLGGKLRYLRSLARIVFGAWPGTVSNHPGAGCAPADVDLVLCGHINLLPIAVLARLVLEARRLRAATRSRPGRAVDCVRRVLRRQPRPRLPVVLVVHGKECWRPTCARWSDFLLGQIDAVIAVSEFSRSRFFSWASIEGKPGFVLPNCVDLNRFTPGERSEEWVTRYQLRRPVLMTLARLSAGERYKGIDEVLELMPALRKELPEITYVIAGDGGDRSRLVHKALSLGLKVSAPEFRSPGTASVVFTGYVPEEEKPDLYRTADVFVMPGWGEGFGIVYLEALGCGVPVVGSKADASREILQGCESAFLADPGDPDDIWNAICLALATPHGAMPNKVHAFSQERFAQQAFAVMNELQRLCTAAGRHSALLRTQASCEGHPKNSSPGPLRAAGI